MNDYKKYTTRNGVQRVQFIGTELAHSSSQTKGKPRWIEFTLYRTKTGKYIIYRVGLSSVYHKSSCPMVTKNKLGQYQEEFPPHDAMPCEDCRPSAIEIDGFYLETARYTTYTADSPEGVISILNKSDASGVYYLTNVARKLLVSASQADPDLAEAYYDYHID